MTEIKVPTLGESVTEATVATWFKSPGDTVAIDEMLCELETDKVTVEVPSTVSGTLSEIIAKRSKPACPRRKNPKIISPRSRRAKGNTFLFLLEKRISTPLSSGEYPF